MRFFVLFLGLLLSSGAYAAGLEDALLMAQRECVGISDDLSDLKKMAGIGAAVSGASAVAGGVALGTGIAKANVDEELKKLRQEILELASVAADVEIKHVNVDWAEFDRMIAGIDVGEGVAQQKEAEEEKLEKKSKVLGNVRTGALGVSTVSNIVGAVVSSESKVKGDLEQRVNAFLAAIKVLKNEYGQALVARSETEERLSYVKDVVSGCEEWEMVDLSVVNSGARGAVVSSGVAAGVGAIGTVTSAMANSDSVRVEGGKKEDNLNKVSNVMAGGTGVASVAATVFNVKQINSIKKIVAIAEKCEGAFVK